MESITGSPAVKRIILLLLLVAVCSESGINSHRAQARSTPGRKISPDLRPPPRTAQTATGITAIIQSKVKSSSSRLDALKQRSSAILLDLSRWPGDGIMIGDSRPCAV